MQATMPITVPALQPKRTYTLSIRLTEAERAEVESLAGRLKLPSSFMARHFILQTIAQYQRGEEAAVES
jgi:predicted metal-dependent HD superfamily phosphohydrolase